SMETAGRLGRNTLDVGQVAAEAARGPHEGAAGAHRRDEVRDAPAGLLDNLGPGTVEVRLPIGRVVVLVGIEVAIGVVFVNLAADANGAVAALTGIAEYGFRAVGFEDALALAAGVARQDELHLVAPVGADHGVGDPGVAAGG